MTLKKRTYLSENQIHARIEAQETPSNHSRMAKTNIVIVGAGVSGLTTGLLLAKNPKYSITVIAKHMPGDYDIEYCSPWAGANYTPFSTAGTREARWEKETWTPLADLAEKVPEAGIHFLKSREYVRDKDHNNTRTTNPWFKSFIPDFRVLDTSELPKGIDGGIEYTSICINPALYLPYLLGRCRASRIIVKRSIITHISQAYTLHHTTKPADIVINCTGLSSLTLGGVLDTTMAPIRGQTILVRNEDPMMIGTTGTDIPDELTYVMMRASGGGTILGGCAQKGNWEAEPDLEMAERIMGRVKELDPGFVGEGLDVVRHAVGLRPWREGGVRLEKERVGEGWCVHNYGHAGYGYQTSFACAGDVVKLVKEIVGERSMA
ncbi:Nucleotide-binding protein [Glarea lozoyensis ATCC 20868]|uniref:Nucleotide-binding protein n=1 Tax=Glarea lozoyensis (strain ATCC 20868 / MF5171) TaxID=1116229 RepID=S3DYJ9_GLAL2|nr:Nucleotide-binding protein [Glarea lozoyensis ATCC 20868]EPE31433.1 Nucleotide-binding protein [Glarea lozoyensis ATCC 20868]